MYTYIIEAEVAAKKYEVELAKIEARVLELHMPGRFEKLTILKSLREIIADAVKQKAETIVVIGSDKIVSAAVTEIAPLGGTLGIIPVGSQSNIAHALGIPDGVAACDTLSARIVEHIDLGKVNNRFFLFGIDIPDVPSLTLECDGQFHVSTASPSSIEIRNFGEDSNPCDGRLEVVVRPKVEGGFFRSFRQRVFSKASVFPFKKVTIRCPGDSVPIQEAGQTIVKTPATVEVAPSKLKVIVGKQRSFA